jgi:hypothetical protein
LDGYLRTSARRRRRNHGAARGTRRRAVLRHRKDGSRHRKDGSGGHRSRPRGSARGLRRRCSRHVRRHDRNRGPSHRHGPCAAAGCRRGNARDPGHSRLGCRPGLRHRVIRHRVIRHTCGPRPRFGRHRYSHGRRSDRLGLRNGHIPQGVQHRRSYGPRRYCHASFRLRRRYAATHCRLQPLSRPPAHLILHPMR